MTRTVEVDWLRPGVMEFVYQGQVTEEDLTAAIDRYKELTAREAPKVQLVDTLQVTGVPPSLNRLLATLLDEYRAQGGKHVVMAASSHLNKMLGRSMSFGAGLKLALCESREDALEHIDQLD
jgi:hypothetical protein